MTFYLLKLKLTIRFSSKVPLFMRSNVTAYVFVKAQIYPAYMVKLSFVRSKFIADAKRQLMALFPFALEMLYLSVWEILDGLVTNFVHKDNSQRLARKPRKCLLSLNEFKTFKMILKPRYR